MNLEQISIDDILNKNVDYVHDDHQCCGVYPKLDWLTFMFNDCSLNDVFYWLNLDTYSDEIAQSLFTTVFCAQDNVTFTYCGIRIDVNRYAYYNVTDSVFDYPFEKIRVDLSGSGLDYLRSLGWDFYEFRFTRPFVSSSGAGCYHLTRCDFAFDFVNYKAGFVDQLIDFCNNNMLPSGRVPIISDKRSAINFEFRKGKQKTVYLGSKNSAKLLRVYDKRLQYINGDTGIYVSDNPYNNPDSWFRIELQTRDKFANDLLLSIENGVYNTFEDILKYIFDSFAFADAKVDGNYNKRQPVDFWLKLFPWEEVKTKIIQNAKYVQPKTPDAQLDDFEDRYTKQLICVLARYGDPHKLAASLDARLLECQTPEKYKRFASWLNFILALGLPIADDKTSATFFYRDCGKLRIKH